MTIKLANIKNIEPIKEKFILVMYLHLICRQSQNLNLPSISCGYLLHNLILH